MELFVQRTRRVVENVLAARSRRTFLAALADFERMLTVPLDYPLGCFSDTDAEALRSLADAVIEEIEQRLDTHGGRAAQERQLVGTIYRIRAEVEVVYIRLRHECAENASRNAEPVPVVPPSR